MDVAENGFKYSNLIQIICVNSYGFKLLFLFYNNNNNDNNQIT